MAVARDRTTQAETTAADLRTQLDTARTQAADLRTELAVATAQRDTTQAQADALAGPALG